MSGFSLCSIWPTLADVTPSSSAVIIAKIVHRRTLKRSTSSRRTRRAERLARDALGEESRNARGSAIVLRTEASSDTSALNAWHSSRRARARWRRRRPTDAIERYPMPSEIGRERQVVLESSATQIGTPKRLSTESRRDLGGHEKAPGRRERDGTEQHAHALAAKRPCQPARHEIDLARLLQAIECGDRFMRIRSAEPATAAATARQTSMSNPL